MKLVPVITMGQTYDDNYYSQAGDSDEFHIQTLGWQLDGDIQDGPHEYQAQYQGKAGFVENSSADNYVDQVARLFGDGQLVGGHGGHRLTGEDHAVDREHGVGARRRLALELGDVARDRDVAEGGLE